MRRVREDTQILCCLDPAVSETAFSGGARGLALSSSSPALLYDGGSGPQSPFYHVMGGTGARRGREQEPTYRTESMVRQPRSFEGFSSEKQKSKTDIRSPQDRGTGASRHSFSSDIRSPQDRFVRRIPACIEQGSVCDSGQPTPAPGPITRRVLLDYAQHARGTPVRVQHEKPGKPPRRAQHQHETRQANINRSLAAWCEQERERALKTEREGVVDSKGGELQGFASTNVVVGGNKSRFGAFTMLFALWMVIHTSLGSWAQRLQSMLKHSKRSKQPASQLVPGMRAGSARGPQTKLERCKEKLRLAKLALERRKEELRHAENAFAQQQLEVLQAEIHVATIAREGSGVGDQAVQQSHMVTLAHVMR